MATVLITGANKGIGLELSRQLTERGDEVIALCRNASPELRGLGVRLFEGVDVTDRAALENVSRDLGETKIDVLINNAGIFENETFGDLDFERIRRSSRSTHSGHCRSRRSCRVTSCRAPRSSS